MLLYYTVAVKLEACGVKRTISLSNIIIWAHPYQVSRKTRPFSASYKAVLSWMFPSAAWSPEIAHQP